MSEYTQEEMFAEFWEYLLDDKPNADWELDGTGDDVQFKTGDPEIDFIEEALAKGQQVDIAKVLMSPAAYTAFKKYQKTLEPAAKEAEAVTEMINNMDEKKGDKGFGAIDEDFTKDENGDTILDFEK